MKKILKEVGIALVKVLLAIAILVPAFILLLPFIFLSVLVDALGT